MRAETEILPAFLASALINGDTSSIEDNPEDMAMLEQVIAYCAPGRIVSCEGGPWFQWGCHPFTSKGIDVMEYTILYPEDAS